MIRTAEQRVGWRLVLEPIGGDVAAWSLVRVGGTPADTAIGAGLLRGLGPLRELAAQLVSPKPSDWGPGVRDGLWSGPLVRPGTELECAVRFGLGLLPAELRSELLASQPAMPADRAQHTVTIACRGWPARLPWEALALDRTGDVRLIERARVTAGLSPALAVGRRLSPQVRPDAPAVRIVDPGPRAGGLFPPIYPGGYPRNWDDNGMLAAGEDLVPDGLPYDRAALSDLLRRPSGWSRLLYVGHALPGTQETPSRAALVLSTPTGPDLLTAHAWMREPARWPAPVRVALIACATDDRGHVEQAGLPVAAVNAGAELLTVTRWTLPTDYDPPREAGTTELSVAVDAAHRQADPVDALRAWQCTRLAAWRDGEGRADSPLLWGSLATYLVPPVTWAEV